MISVFKLAGVIGILLLSAGILSRERKKQDIYYVTGGVFLASYSFYVGDFIFIAVQVIFTIAAAYDLLRQKK